MKNDTFMYLQFIDYLMTKSMNNVTKHHYKYKQLAENEN
jgi:hypothetical protein